LAEEDLDKTEKITKSSAKGTHKSIAFGWPSKKSLKPSSLTQWAFIEKPSDTRVLLELKSKHQLSIKQSRTSRADALNRGIRLITFFPPSAQG